MKPVARHVVGSLAALLVAAAGYLHGVWVGHFLDLRPTSGYCRGKPLGAPPLSWSWLPLTDRCHFSDGSTRDLVPSYVNPIVFAALAVAALCVVLAIRAARRRPQHS